MQTRNEWNPYVNSIWADYLNHQKLKEKIENEYQYFIYFFNEHLKEIKKKVSSWPKIMVNFI